MSYPRNAASPERVDIGPVIQISDGAVQTSGVAVKVIPFGGTEATGGGTVAYSVDGVVLYTPTQAETNYTSFILVASKASCIPAAKTVVTSASGTAGYSGLDWGKITAPTTTVALTGTTISATYLPPTAAAIADAVWDEILIGATHNIQNSAGKRLRTIASQVVHTGTAQGPGTGSNQIQLDTGASATDGIYDPAMLYIESGTGVGQSRLITQYVGSTRTATVDRDWRVAPAADSVFVIQATIGFNSVNEGLAQGGTATTIVLNSSANSVDDCYNGQLVFLKSGTGQDQVAIVEDYTGSTRTALIRTRRTNGQWATIPDSTTGYMMVPNLTWTIDEIQAGLATATNQTTILDRQGYTLAVLAGTISDAQTAAETYAITLGANTFTVDFAGLDASGNRTGQTLTKV